MAQEKDLFPGIHDRRAARASNVGIVDNDDGPMLYTWTVPLGPVEFISNNATKEQRGIFGKDNLY